MEERKGKEAEARVEYMGRRLAIVEDVQMGGVDQPSHRNMADAATSMTTMTYAQVAAQTHADVRK